ncbi:MAG: hypothetical protein KJ550_12050 [Proteobacteria bacterium]|nr:hypothetical protein [Pseudomonadota bacterium]MBU3980504.1 hypothetical protein [Pseudomonadota bacterium]MBU4014182.1 hypothetical protein [Pseudomonadota bacterium]MBU4067714.1 hypothetical protein [Pseudomonadota bacterium]MBU4101323.1 hypothetical protein [Pseudomonadota bacterium]
MTDSVDKKTYTFFMPGEERIYFRYFHIIAITILLIMIAIQVLASETTVTEAIVTGLIFVSPVYFVYFVFGKRFADSVTLDFNERKVRFSFSDERGSFKRDFQDIKKINFKFYLTFVMDDARIMVKRPHNKKEVFRLLKNVSMVDVGMFGGI